MTSSSHLKKSTARAREFNSRSFHWWLEHPYGASYGQVNILRRRRGKNSTPARSGGGRGGRGGPRIGMQRWTHSREDSLRTRYRKCLESGSGDAARARATVYVGGPAVLQEGSSSFLLSAWIRDSAVPAIRKNPVVRMTKKKGRRSRPRNPEICRVFSVLGPPSRVYPARGSLLSHPRWPRLLSLRRRVDRTTKSAEYLVEIFFSTHFTSRDSRDGSRKKSLAGC